MRQKQAKQRFLSTERGPLFYIEARTGQRRAIGVTREIFATLNVRDQLAAFKGLRLQPDPRRRG